jgi:hypothetical protein
MKELKHLYVGNISSVAGYYMFKLVAACPKVRYFVLILQLTHLAMLNVWNGGLSEEGIESLASHIRERRDLVSLHLQISQSARLLVSYISRVFADRALFLELVVLIQSGEEMVKVSPRGVVLESRFYSTEFELLKNYLPRCRLSSLLE